jgi:hypothetical protein
MGAAVRDVEGKVLEFHRLSGAMQNFSRESHEWMRISEGNQSSHLAGLIFSLF